MQRIRKPLAPMPSVDRHDSVSVTSKLTPVALPPGRLRLVTKPNLTGSCPTMNTSGIVTDAAFAANASGSPPTVTMTAARFCTKSAARAGSWSYRPSELYRDVFSLFVSKLARPWRNAATGPVTAADDRLLRKPTSGSAGCCTDAESGRATAMPSAAINPVVALPHPRFGRGHRSGSDR